MLRDISLIEKEKAYLTFLASLYEEEPGHLESLPVLFGFRKARPGKRKPHQIKITEADFKTINSLLHYLNETTPDEACCKLLKKTYERGCNQSTGLPVWAKDSQLYMQLIPDNEENVLPEEETHFMDKFSAGGDKIKRFSDLAEDTISSAIRMPGGLIKIPENVVHGAVGGTNLGNTSFEFIKALWDFYIAYKMKDARFRPENLADAGMRINLSSIGISVCALYLAGILLTPFALAGIAMVTLLIYLLPFLKNGYIYFAHLKKDFEKSSSEEFLNERDKLAEELQSLEIELNALQTTIENDLRKNMKTPEELESGIGRKHISYEKLQKEYFAKKYQLASINHRINHDKTAYLQAWDDFKMSAIELAGYVLVASGAFLGLAIFISPAGPIVASLAFIAAVSGVGIITACKFLPSIIKAASFAYNNPREFGTKILMSLLSLAALPKKAWEKIHAFFSKNKQDPIEPTQDSSSSISTLTPLARSPGLLARMYLAVKRTISNFSFYNKGNLYWSSKWEEELGTSTIKAYQLLERYAQSSKATYCKAVRNEYYGGRIPENAPGCRGAVEIVKQALNNQAIKKNGDLHKILEVFSKTDKQNYTNEFNIEKRPTIAKSIFSLFHSPSRASKKRPQRKALLKKPGRHEFTKT